MSDNLTFNYAKLKGRIVEKFGTQRDFASSMGMSEGSLSAKLLNKSYFSSNEIATACELLDIQPAKVSEYFFDTMSSEN